ncbi:hypothetical protein ABXV23_10910 [Vibrio owensii]|uniref:hypothetical protein n=1 Tax=Vibrio owensii TaxID=696485 RepID=UPI0033965F7A
MKNIIVILAASLSTFASAAIVEKTVTGHGDSISNARNDALVLAVESHFGIDIKNKSSSIKDSSLSTKEGNYSSSYNDQVSQVNHKFSEGRIAGFDVISELCDSNGQCSSKLKVKLEEDDKKKAINSRETIAFYQIKHEFGPKLFNSMQTQFVQARKFAVLESLDAPELDYSLDVTIRSAYTKSSGGSKKVDPLTGNVTYGKRNYNSYVKADYKVKSVSTGQVVWSDAVVTTSGRNNLDLLIKLTGEKIFKQVHEIIFPVRVATVSGNDVVLATGGKSIKVGQVFNVMHIGEVIYDPVSGEALEQVETNIAQIKISSVSAKTSRGQLIKGELSGIYPGAIVREAKVKAIAKPKTTQKTVSKATQKPVNESSIVDKENGGVIL